MIWFAGILSATIVFIVLFFLFSERARGKRAFDQASASAEENNFEAACYYYSISACAGYRGALCREKVRALWKSAGPLTFEMQWTEINSNPPCHETCARGFHETQLVFITKLTGAEIKPSP